MSGRYITHRRPFGEVFSHRSDSGVPCGDCSRRGLYQLLGLLGAVAGVVALVLR